VRTSTLARGGALLTAVTVAFTLGSGPASASDSHDTVIHPKVLTRSFGSHPTASGAKLTGSKLARALRNAGTKIADSGVLGENTITEIKQKNIAMYEEGDYIWDGSATFTGIVGDDDGDLDYWASSLFVGGKDRGQFEFGYANPPYINGPGLLVPSTVATGKARLGPTETHYNNPELYPNTVSNKHSNYFYIRRGTGSTATGEGTNYPFYLVIGNKSINFHANHWKIFKPSTGQIVPMNTIKLQYRLHHEWVTLKTIQLKSTSGSGTYTVKRTSTKHNYRLYYPTTDTIYGSYTDDTGNI
jgi:hypothetical protein